MARKPFSFPINFNQPFSDLRGAAGLSPVTSLFSRSLFQRIVLLILLFSLELTVISVWLDNAELVRGHGILRIMHDWGAWILRCIVGFAVVFLTFSYLKNRAEITRIAFEIKQAPFRWGLFGAHCIMIGIFAGLSFFLYGGGVPDFWTNLVATGWFAAGSSAIAFAAFAFLPGFAWAKMIRATGFLWAYALVAVVSACIAGTLVWRLWQVAGYLTLHLTKVFLSPFISGIIVNPSTMMIGTQRFNVEIAPQCSGLEGIGLILAFAILWLLVFRKECRFPRSLIVIPFGVTIIFLLNSIRIAALIVIGNAGAEQIALGGFHSQAGWIAFSAVGASLCFIVERVPWFTTRPQSWESIKTVQNNPTAAFLVPFLMILAAGMIANAARGTADLEWLYPLRFVAGASMLWIFRGNYRSLSWRCGWLAPIIGAVVFLAWIGLDRTSAVADYQLAAALSARSAPVRVTWIAIRVLAAITTVPLAEELTFRGYLMRRFLGQNFEAVSLHRFSWLGLLVSSVAFGLLHGGYWVAGILAGLLFGWVTIRRGRIGDAVIAHATANAMLAAYILVYHKWHLW